LASAGMAVKDNLQLRDRSIESESNSGWKGPRGGDLPQRHTQNSGL